jgi:hypothetical protein
MARPSGGVVAWTAVVPIPGAAVGEERMSDEQPDEIGMPLVVALRYLDPIGRATDAHMAWAATVDGEHFAITVLSRRMFDTSAARDLIGIYATPVDCALLLVELGHGIEPVDSHGAADPPE